MYVRTYVRTYIHTYIHIYIYNYVVLRIVKEMELDFRYQPPNILLDFNCANCGIALRRAFCYYGCVWLILSIVISGLYSQKLSMTRPPPEQVNCVVGRGLIQPDLGSLV